MIAAAGEVLAVKGYARTRSADIAARAGVSRTTFYEQFANLEECLLAAHQNVAECVLEIVSERTEHGDPCEQLEGAVEGSLDFLASEPSMAKLLGAEISAAVPAIAASREHLAHSLADRLRAGRTGGDPPRAEWATGVETRLLGGALAIVGERIDSGETQMVRELAPDLTRLLANR
jgi:AcrR family transcriptional regulator